MKNIKMLTIVPTSVAALLSKEKRVSNYNTLPQLDSKVLTWIKEYMAERIGYSSLPIACLRYLENSGDVSGEDLISKLPINSKTSVLFQLEMPPDMIVSIGFGDLLDISEEAKSAIDDDDLEFVKERLWDSLVLGVIDDISDPISFIPFLAADRCKFYARFNEDFDTADKSSLKLEKVTIRELSSFLD